MKSTPAGGVIDPGTHAPPRVTTGGTTVRIPVKVDRDDASGDEMRK